MINTHVVSLDLALALRDAGYPQENALFYWSIPKPENASNEEERLVLANNCEVELCHKWTDWGDKFDRVAAPLSSELMERMEGRLQHRFLLTIQKPDPDAYSAAYDDTVNAESLAYNCEKTLPDALAKSWLHLRKASLI